jgi:acyl-CoA reductase-like NAD-dependent aldehyde dehydrogenase
MAMAMAAPTPQDGKDSRDSKDGLPGVAVEVGPNREAQAAWAATPLAERLRFVRRLRWQIARRPEALVEAVSPGSGRPAAEILSSEVLPLAEACRFLEREAPRILAPQRPGSAGRPFWLGGLSGVDLEIRRQPLGVVLILAAANYPLFLPGVQTLQALAAGNAVLWKPGRGGLAAARAFASLAMSAGLDARLLQVLDESPEAGRACLASHPDKVFLTGSAATGRQVLADLAERLIPATMELSGCDALFVLPSAGRADLDRIAKAVAFSLRLNGGATCIAPRRVFVSRHLAGPLETRLVEAVSSLPAANLPPEVDDRAWALVREAVEAGARPVAGGFFGPPNGRRGLRPLILADARPDMRLLREDLFAPVVSLVLVENVEDALASAALCPYALGAAIFGPEEEARALAPRVRAGVVVVNDVIVPTADPRLPFGGRGESGFGVTRGAEGLLEMTALQAVTVRQGRFLPHLDEPQPGDDRFFSAYLATAHAGGLRPRLRGFLELLSTAARRKRPARRLWK